MSDRTLLITGGSTGIGAATARKAAEAGWKVALVARSSDKLSALVDEIGSDRAAAFVCDVTKEVEVERAVAQAAEFGSLEAVFANAGLGSTKPGVEGGDPANWRTMLDVNVWGVLLTAHYALPHLRKAGGHMVITGSNAGRRTVKGSIYSATKWFVHGFARNLAEEMAEWGGRCTLIAPGLVDTPFFDSPKPDGLDPEAVADAVVYALSQPGGVSVGEILVTPLDAPS